MEIATAQFDIWELKFDCIHQALLKIADNSSRGETLVRNLLNFLLQMPKDVSILICSLARHQYKSQWDNKSSYFTMDADKLYVRLGSCSESPVNINAPSLLKIRQHLSGTKDGNTPTVVNVAQKFFSFPTSSPFSSYVNVVNCVWNRWNKLCTKPFASRSDINKVR